MKRYILHRICSLIPVLIGITLLTFLLMHTSSVDTIDAMEANTGGVMSVEAKEAARKELGLDKPILVQYGNWIKGILTGNMGTSYVSGEPVLEKMVKKLPATILLALTSILLTIVISIPLGILCAIKKDSIIDHIVRCITFFGNSMPSFFVSLLLIYCFAIQLDLFPIIGKGNDWKTMVLPTLTLTIAMASKYIRQIRTAVLEELGKEYILAARARGIRERKILTGSVLKAVMLTILTLLSLSIGSLLGGTAIVESIFLWDGVGKMAVDAILMRDYPVIQAYVIWMAIIYVAINLLTDILYHVLDPRIRLEREEIE